MQATEAFHDDMLLSWYKQVTLLLLIPTNNPVEILSHFRKMCVIFILYSDFDRAKIV